MKTFKIVLTGGPCGGKTESLDFLKENLIKLNYSVGVVEETANLLLQLGYMPNENISTFDFQHLLFKIQFLNEHNLEGKTQILLCDRGLLDGKAYISNVYFQKILKLNGVKKEEILSTYDAALYFRSISHEFPEKFAKKRIYETSKIGQIRDDYCRELWSEKLVPCDYNNMDGMIQKQKSIYSSLKKQLELMNEKNTKNLSDYYDERQYRLIYGGIDDILEKNNISEEIKVKTKRLLI